MPITNATAEALAQEALEKAADEISAAVISLPDDLERSRNALRRMIAHCDRRAAEAGGALRDARLHAKQRRAEAREQHKALMAAIASDEDAGVASWSTVIETQERLAQAWRAAERELTE